jgi:hypothetical protein
MNDACSTFDPVMDPRQHQHRRIVAAILEAEQRSLMLNDLTQTVLTHDRLPPVLGSALF